MMDPQDVILVLNAHMDYLKRVSDVLDGKADDPKATDCRSCKLGKWVYGEAAGDARLASDADFAKLRQIHEEFHTVTEAAVSAKKSGNEAAGSASLARAYNLYGEISNLLLNLDKKLNG